MLKGIYLVARDAIKEHVRIPALILAEKYHDFWIHDLYNYFWRNRLKHLIRREAAYNQRKFLEKF